MNLSQKIVFAFFITLGLSCGGYTHQEVALRALETYQSQDPIFQNIVNKHKDALFAGATFPDYLYLCGDNHENGELAHWPPFYEAYIELINQKYPQPWTEIQEKRVAFFLGVVSHGIADINWHGIA